MKINFNTLIKREQCSSDQFPDGCVLHSKFSYFIFVLKEKKNSFQYVLGSLDWNLSIKEGESYTQH